MTNALILVDVDNVKVPRWVAAKGPAPDKVVVVLGVSTYTATCLFSREHPVRAEVEHNAQVIVGGLWPEAHGQIELAVETALCIDAPQTVDAALCRLLHESPTRKNAGRFDALYLFTGDKGLHRTIASLAGGRWRLLDTETSVHHARVRLMRRYVSQFALPSAKNIPAQVFDMIGPPASLPQVAELCAQRPALLSQVGPISATVHGVFSLLEGTVSTANLRKDAAQWHELPANEEPVRGTPTPNGVFPSGAVTVVHKALDRAGSRSTLVSTRLPSPVFEAVRAREATVMLDCEHDPVGGSAIYRLREPSALLEMTANHPFGPLIDVSMSPRSLGGPRPGLKLTAHSETETQPPSAYWYMPLGGNPLPRAKSELTVPLPRRTVLTASIHHVRARLQIRLSDRGVFLGCPTEVAIDARLQRALRPGELGMAHSQIGGVAVFNPHECGLPGATRYRCVPAQSPMGRAQLQVAGYDREPWEFIPIFIVLRRLDD